MPVYQLELSKLFDSSTGFEYSKQIAKPLAPLFVAIEL
jgi:hypothetical protein